MEMKFETKYKLGDWVKVARNQYVYETCKICDGKKTVRIKNRDFFCPECQGTGVNNYGELETVCEERKIGRIDYTIKIGWKGEIENSYVYKSQEYGPGGVDAGWHSFYEDEITGLVEK